MDIEKVYFDGYKNEQDRVEQILIDCARHGKTILYSELIKKANLHLDMNSPYDRGILGHLLGYISWNEVQNDRPMLSSVAINKNYRRGQGFFDLAENLYKKKIRTADEKLVFENNELNKTLEYWSKQ